jgi:hypothetical protein
LGTVLSSAFASPPLFAMLLFAVLDRMASMALDANAFQAGSLDAMNVPIGIPLPVFLLGAKRFGRHSALL